MAYDAKKYVDITGLQEFLKQIVWNLKNNTTTEGSEFSVANALHAVTAEKATADSDGNSIKTTYLKSGDAAETYVPITATLAGTAIGKTGISKSDLLTALNVADGAQVNVIETVKVRPSGATDDTTDQTLTVTNKTVVVDLSSYATKQDVNTAVTSLFKFKGIKANVDALPASGNTVGDVWHVTSDDGEYVWLDVGDGQEGPHWELLSHNLANYYTKNEVYTKTEVNGIRETLEDKIEVIYTPAVPAHGEPGDEDYTPAVAASGLLVDEETRAKGVEAGLQSAINTLNGNDTTSGSVAKSIKDAIDALDYSGATTGDYVTQVTEANGVITVTRDSKATSVNSSNENLVTSKAVYSYVETFKESLAVASVGSNGSYLKTISEANGKITATPQAFDTTIGPASGTGAATNDNAPTTLAVRTELDAVYAAFGSVTNAQIDGLFTRTAPAS
jgi:hypothetical protein